MTKEEKKDEMKNRISLALKDPILQQGFEIICKENATLKVDYGCLEDAHNVLNELYEKLEKENERLTVSYETLKLHDEEEIGMLKSENAKLKETLKTYNGCGDWDNDFHTCRVYLQHEELQMYADQLTKAKELLAKWVELFKPKGGNIPPTPIQVETEQFLNSELQSKWINPARTTNDNEIK